LKKCNSCQTEIDEKAKKCPNCKSDQRNFFLRHKIMSAVLVLVVIIIGSSIANGGKSGSNSGANTNSVDKTATVVDVKAFGDEFDANQVAAESKYKNKYIQFSAPISNITDSGLSFQNVTSKDFSTTQISCNISDKNAVLALKNGESVTVKGKITGQTIGVINMDDCSLVK